MSDLPPSPPPLPPRPPRPPPLPPPLPAHLVPGYQGLGGWLVLVGIQLILAPLWYISSLIQTYLPLFTAPGRWALITDPQRPDFSQLLVQMIIGEAAAISVFLVICLALLFLFFGKKRYFPRVMICYLVAVYAYIVADYILAQHIPMVVQQDNPGTLIVIYLSGILCCLWVPYFVVSKRVKATFIR